MEQGPPDKAAGVKGSSVKLWPLSKASAGAIPCFEQDVLNECEGAADQNHHDRQPHEEQQIAAIAQQVVGAHHQRHIAHQHLQPQNAHQNGLISGRWVQLLSSVHHQQRHQAQPQQNAHRRNHLPGNQHGQLFAAAILNHAEEGRNIKPVFGQLKQRAAAQRIGDRPTQGHVNQKSPERVTGILKRQRGAERANERANARTNPSSQTHDKANHRCK